MKNRRNFIRTIAGDTVIATVAAAAVPLCEASENWVGRLITMCHERALFVRICEPHWNLVTQTLELILPVYSSDGSYLYCVTEIDRSDLVTNAVDAKLNYMARAMAKHLEDITSGAIGSLRWYPTMRAGCRIYQNKQLA